MVWQKVCAVNTKGRQIIFLPPDIFFNFSAFKGVHNNQAWQHQSSISHTYKKHDSLKVE
jgi:hypothetical protein